MDHVYTYLIITILVLVIGVALITTAHHDRESLIQAAIWIGWFAVAIIALTGVVYWSKTSSNRILTYGARNVFIFLCILVTLMCITTGILAILWNTGGDCNGAIITGRASLPFWGAIIVFIGSIGPILMAFEAHRRTTIILVSPVPAGQLNQNVVDKLQSIYNSAYIRQSFPAQAARAQKLMISYRGNPIRYRDEVNEFINSTCDLSIAGNNYDRDLIDKLIAARDIAVKRKIISPERVTEVIEKYKKDPVANESSARSISDVLCGIPGESCDEVNPNPSPDLLRRLEQIRDSVKNDDSQSAKIDNVIQSYKTDARKFYQVAKFVADDYCSSSGGTIGCSRWSS